MFLEIGLAQNDAWNLRENKIVGHRPGPGGPRRFPLLGHGDGSICREDAQTALNRRPPAKLLQGQAGAVRSGREGRLAIVHRRCAKRNRALRGKARLDVVVVDLKIGGPRPCAGAAMFRADCEVRRSGRCAARSPSVAQIASFSGRWTVPITFGLAIDGEDTAAFPSTLPLRRSCVCSSRAPRRGRQRKSARFFPPRPAGNLPGYHQAAGLVQRRGHRGQGPGRSS